MRTHGRSILSLPLAALLVAATVATAGPATEDLQITGRVVDHATGQPLRGAQLHFRGTVRGTLTDSDGHYALSIPVSLIPADGLYLEVALIGYGRQEALVRVPDAGAGPLTIDFRLEQQALTLDALVVTGGGNTVVQRTRAAAIARTASSARPAAGAPQPRMAQRRAAVVTGHSRHGYHPLQGNREQYAHIEENGFKRVEDAPLSTFSVDVDRASYSNVRRFLLREGRLPPADAVQVEEMINYFSYDYDLPTGEHPVAVTTEVGEAPWARDHRLLRVGLASQPISTADMPPANLVFLLDVSGSMSSPDKLPLVQASLGLLVDHLRPVDRVAIVVYAGGAGMVLEPTSGAHKREILSALDRLHAGGSTAGGAGLRLAYDVARRHFQPEGNNRVVLATDGDFNVGESSDAAMIRLIEEKRAQGTFLTVLGFGTGNLQSEKMQQLAQHGNGNYAYIDGLREARKVLVAEMGGTLLTVAKDVKIQVEFNPSRVRAYRLLGYENRLMAAEDFNDDTRDAGEMGAGHTVTALYEIVPVGVDVELPGAVDPLRYGEAARTPEGSVRWNADASEELAFVKVRYKRPDGEVSQRLEHPVADRLDDVSSDFTFAAAVAGFGMLLRESEYRGSISAPQVMALAEDGLGSDPGGYRRGFLELVRAYGRLSGHHRPGHGGH